MRVTDKYIVIWRERLLPVAVSLIPLTARIVILHGVAYCFVNPYVRAVYIFSLSHDVLILFSPPFSFFFIYFFLFFSGTTSFSSFGGLIRICFCVRLTEDQ